jgi:hypothetical protein
LLEELWRSDGWEEPKGNNMEAIPETYRKGLKAICSSSMPAYFAHEKSELNHVGALLIPAFFA